MAINFPDIDPVALSLGPLEIRWYALAYLVGILLGWKYANHWADKDKDHRPNKDDIDSFLTWSIVGIILGGRLGYVLFYQTSYYLQNPAEILMVWHGGMSFHGGLLGVFVAMVLFAKINKIQTLRLTDIICAVAPIGLFFGRLANFANAELYGRTTNQPWGVVFPNAGDLPRHPSQLYEAALEGIALFLILFLVMKSDKARNTPGLTSGVFLAGYGLFRAFVEFYREPDAHIGYISEVFTMGQMLCLPMIIGGIIVMFVANTMAKQSIQPSA